MRQTFWGHNLASRQSAVASAVFSHWDQQTVALLAPSRAAWLPVQRPSWAWPSRAALVHIRRSRFLALLSFYRAVGGGWVRPSGPILDQFP